MDYIIEYCPPFELFRIMQAVIIDNRATLFPAPPQNYNGNTIQSYVDGQVAMVTANVVLYKILTLNGNLVGYFSLQFMASYSVNKLQQLIRPQYEYDVANIDALIDTFVASNAWANDFLF